MRISSLMFSIATLFTLNSNSFATNEKVVAISQIVEHPSLNESRAGVEDAIKASGLPVQFNYENANGSLTTAVQIAQKFAGQNPDVIVAISTPSAQTIASATMRTKTPVVFVTVTSPVQAKLITNMKHPAGHITGTSDSPPYAKQNKLIHELLPHAKNIGVVYNPGEINSVDMIHHFKNNDQSFNVITAAATNANEIVTALRSLIGKIDAIYLPMDNTVVSALEIVLKIARDNKLPIIASDPDSVKRGALFSIGYNQYDVGYLAGQKVVQILNGTKPGDIPVTAPETTTISINLKTAQELGITVNDTFLSKANDIIK